MKVRECQLRGEESLSIVRRGRWVWKAYKPLDPTGRWPGEHFWRQQLERRVEWSRRTLNVNPVRRWFPDTLTAVSLWIEPMRETTAGDVAWLRCWLGYGIGDVTPRNVIVGENGPVLIDFCVWMS